MAAGLKLGRGGCCGCILPYEQRMFLRDTITMVGGGGQGASARCSVYVRGCREEAARSGAAGSESPEGLWGSRRGRGGWGPGATLMSLGSSHRTPGSRQDGHSRKIYQASGRLCKKEGMEHLGKLQRGGEEGPEAGGVAGLGSVRMWE